MKSKAIRAVLGLDDYSWVPKRLLKDITWLAKIHLQGRDLQPDSNEEFCAALVKLGFKEQYHSGCQSRTHWIHKGHGVILKYSYMTAKIVKLSIPTIFIRQRGQARLVLQPLASVDYESQSAVKKFFDWLQDDLTSRQHILRFGNDCHEYNIGLWRGMPVMIDW